MTRATHGLSARAAIIVTAAIFGLTYGLSAPLIALDLAAAGLGEAWIGLNAAMHAVGVLAVAPLLPGLSARIGPRRLALAALGLAALMLVLFPAAPSVWLWFPLRLVLGAASDTLFVVSETWLNGLTEEGSRARTMATYTAALSLGFALGPAILAVTGAGTAMPYLLGAAIALAALGVTAVARVAAVPIERPQPGTTLRNVMLLAPVALTATALNAGLETAGLAFLPLYAIGLGWTESSAALLISMLMLGAVLLQLPIGWLGDRMDRHRLVVLLAAISALGAVLWPFVLALPLIAYPMLFVWGGVFVGIYTMMITIVGSRFAGGQLVAIYAMMSVAWGVGALVGPPVGGAAMHLHDHGLPLAAALACAAFAVFALRRGRSA